MNEPCELDIEYYAMQSEISRLTAENVKLRKLVKCLMFVKPHYVNAIFCKGKLFRFDDLLAEVGMQWENLLADEEMLRVIEAES